MAENDITTSIEATDEDVSSLKKDHYKAAGIEGTRMAPPARMPEKPKGLNQQLLNMITLGHRFASFGGVDRCILVIDQGTDHAHHCGAMIVSNLSTNQKMCSSCDRVKDPNARPKIINSSMIRLNDKELAECGLTEDPLLNAKPDPLPKPKKAKAKAEPTEAPRRTKVKTPNTVKIEVTMKELQSDSNVVGVLLQKTLDAIFELPVSNFREAEEIRVVKERVEAHLKASYGANAQ